MRAVVVLIRTMNKGFLTFSRVSIIGNMTVPVTPVLSIQSLSGKPPLSPPVQVPSCPAEGSSGRGQRSRPTYYGMPRHRTLAAMP